MAEAEADLAATRRHLASVLEAIGSIVWTAHNELGFVDPQPSWEHYTGQAAEEYAGFGYLDAIHPDDRKTLGDISREASRTDTVWEAEARLWNAASGTYRHCLSRGAPLRDEAGAVSGWVGICTDIHEQVVAKENAQAISTAAQAARAVGIEEEGPVVAVWAVVEVSTSGPGRAGRR